MNDLLVVFIMISVALHIAEHLMKKGKEVVAAAHVVFHICAVFTFLARQLALTDLFLYLLCSLIAALLLKIREWKNGF